MTRVGDWVGEGILERLPPHSAPALSRSWGLRESKATFVDLKGSHVEMWGYLLVLVIFQIVGDVSDRVVVAEPEPGCCCDNYIKLVLPVFTFFSCNHSTFSAAWTSPTNRLWPWLERKTSSAWWYSIIIFYRTNITSNKTTKTQHQPEVVQFTFSLATLALIKTKYRWKSPFDTSSIFPLWLLLSSL